MAIPGITFEDIVNKTKIVLGANYREELNEQNVPIDLEEVCAIVIREAAQWTNRFKEEELQEVMNDCWPVIVKCACMAYLNRGIEGLNSRSELGQQDVYNDWVTLMHKQITNRRYVI